ncbi:hypothetical protein ACFXG4_04980 [Nocardia sp. NPDC059246]|uniref:hypothetical protein n=1 Tax=unclassified Nocardia TaxID=2637762 RepID=UPI003678AF16
MIASWTDADGVTHWAADESKAHRKHLETAPAPEASPAPTAPDAPPALASAEAEAVEPPTKPETSRRRA